VRWWWLSICVKVSKRFIGGVFIEGTDPEDAWARAYTMGVRLDETVDYDVKAEEVATAAVMARVPPERRGVLLAPDVLADMARGLA
jgi:hypothetical protein